MSDSDKTQTYAVLLDIQGTLMSESGGALPHAGDAVRALNGLAVPVRFVTNIDSVRVSTIVDRLQSAGIPVQPNEVFTPVAVALRFLERQSRPRCHLLLPDEIACDFEPFRASNGRADYVLVGDCREGFTYERLNEAFRYLESGASLLALQKGRYFLSPSGPTLDTGAFVSALEYASGTQAHVFGKPSTELLRLAIVDVGCDPFDVVVVGDDVGSDIASAHAVGARSVLVRTGKFSLSQLEQSELKPDLLIDSVADVPAALQELSR